MENKATVHILVDHPALFWGRGDISYQGDCPADPAHQTCIELGESECPVCGKRFLATLVAFLGKPTEVMVMW